MLMYHKLLYMQVTSNKLANTTKFKLKHIQKIHKINSKQLTIKNNQIYASRSRSFRFLE
jgi:hypothetical protein